MKRHIIVFLRSYTLACLGLLAALPAGAGRHQLNRAVRRIIAGCDAAVGVSVRCGGQEICTVGAKNAYPLMSVFKLHLAMAVLDSLKRSAASADERVYVAEGTLVPGTYSPLRDSRGSGGFDISLDELLTLALTQSDNHACDILLHHFGGPEAVERYARRNGCLSTFIGATEEDMHRYPQTVHANRAVPADVTLLLEQLVGGKTHAAAERSWLMQTLENCRTGTDRLAAPLTGLPTVLGHKTGTSDRGSDGRYAGINDAGYVILPDGRHYTIAVFVSGWNGKTEEAEHLIARISETVYRHIIAGSVAQPDARVTPTGETLTVAHSRRTPDNHK